MAYIVNTKIENQTNGYSLDAKNVKGTYVAVATLDERNNLPEATLTAGSLCYCVENSTFYQFDGTEWQVANLGGSGGVDEDQVRAIVEDVLLEGQW